MSLDLFRVLGGVQIDDSIQILEGAGIPTLDAPLGSVYSDTSSGSVGYFLKISSGVGADKWMRLATTAEVQAYAATAISWREPVVRRSTLTTIPASTVNTIDGHIIAAGDRVLFSEVAGENVYVASGISGAWVWTEDTNLETAGDTVYVTGGTDAGKTYTFNGTNWVWISQESSDELGFLRAFVGKNAAGNELPDYTSTNQIADGQSLETAISALDATFGSDIGAANQVTPGGTVFGNISELDSTIGADVTNGNYILAANTINANIQALDTEIGAQVVSSGVILSTNSVNANITALNAEGLKQGGVTTGTASAVDTLPVGTSFAKWIIKVLDGVNVRAEEVLAVTNGSSVDYTRYAALKIGSALTPFSAVVTLSGTQLVLTVTGPAGSTVTIKRVSVS